MPGNTFVSAARFAAAAGVAALVFGGASWRSAEPLPFLDPATLASSVCGGKSERAFVAFAQAAARAEPNVPSLKKSARAPLVYKAFHRKITTSSAEAQAWFDEGLAHYANFDHDAAARAFQKAQQADPECAMCFWGEALSYGPNINAPMADEKVAPANAAVRRAAALKRKADPSERELIDALSRRYPKSPVKDRAPFDEAFADALEALAKKRADDSFILTLAAEAAMTTQPWTYWAPDGRTPDGRTAQALRHIETALKRDPNDVVAIHLYIHLTEASFDPHRAIPYAERLAALTPGLGHLIHMPAHTYYRIGRYKQSLELNRQAAAADEAWIRAGEAGPTYQYGYYVHNLHFILTSAQMAGDGATALEMAAKLDENLPEQFVDAAPFSQPIKAAPFFAMAQYASPASVLAAPRPGKEYPFLEGAWRYARGSALLREGDVAAARAEAAALKTLVEQADFTALVEATIPAADILAVAERTLEARALAAEGKLSEAIEAMTEAVGRQETLNYNEPPYWYYPAKQTLAALNLRAGNAERAEQLFMESLVEAPNDGRSLFGLAEALAAQKDRAGARFARALFRKAWAGDPKSLRIDQL
ncbi:MAG: hypothetical protein K2Q06_15065 [Parvularculaceae bacterium]|nr:hypothetical protein [Parvularculaceae bacterium]